MEEPNNARVPKIAIMPKHEFASMAQSQGLFRVILAVFIVMSAVDKEEPG